MAGGRRQSPPPAAYRSPDLARDGRLLPPRLADTPSTSVRAFRCSLVSATPTAHESTASGNAWTRASGGPCRCQRADGWKGSDGVSPRSGTGRPSRRRADQKWPHRSHEYHAITHVLPSSGATRIRQCGHSITAVNGRSTLRKGATVVPPCIAPPDAEIADAPAVVHRYCEYRRGHQNNSCARL